MLRFENLSKTYGHITALKTVTLEAKKGEIRGLLGGNGSGKSTLVKIAGGAVAPDSGRIFVSGKEVKFHSPKEASKNGVAMTSQELSIVSNLSVWENMFLSAMPVRGPFINKKEAIRQCLEMLDELNLKHRINTNVYDLPKNEQYMLEFGKALVQESRILMIDEITSALYAENVEVVRKKLK
jgi:ABC-type sugar transport system ATPase subunit